ncbi:hypothetical protein B0H66DRAFT_92260 [Apodospora peruviana]|uniref:Uncharacterized protein n=1 Tax=Apodospora peruviana TaxID=516989 RepID=A0AAE0ITV5_9PEZI|nr:hypothetical protein B0H66DRAFT_92260 [Apodospora peruviana]
MPRPARTQVDSYVFNDPSSAAMSLTTTAQGSSPGDGRITPIPTPELQKLYSHWRQLQEFDELQKQGSGPGSNDGENGFLRPPSPSQATTMSRSPSCASTTNSVTREITNMGISGSEERPQGTTTRRKQGRQGPLDSTDKARTAFVRKLRACGKCHRRKVKCVHYNFSLFEQAYQATKRMAPFAAQGPPFSSPNLSSPNRHTQQHDLMGVGNMDAFPSYIPALDQGDAHSDLEALLLQSQTQGAPVSTSPLYNFARTALCSSVPLTRNTANLPSSAGDRHVPIGRLVIRDDGQEQMAGTKLQQGEWECRFGDDGTAASDSGASGDICKQRYDDLSGLSGHFQFEHMPFHDPKFFPRCKECELHGTEDMWVVCWQCEAPREMEKWYFGNIRTSTPSLTSGVSVRVADQDGPWGFMNNSQSPNYQFNGPFLSSTGAAQIGNSSLLRLQQRVHRRQQEAQLEAPPDAAPTDHPSGLPLVPTRPPNVFALAHPVAGHTRLHTWVAFVLVVVIVMFLIRACSSLTFFCPSISSLLSSFSFLVLAVIWVHFSRVYSHGSSVVVVVGVIGILLLVFSSTRLASRFPC